MRHGAGQRDGPLVEVDFPYGVLEEVEDPVLPLLLVPGVSRDSRPHAGRQEVRFEVVLS